MNILITGGTGFIGSRLALDCLAKGHHVTVLGQENNAKESQNRRLIEAKGGTVILVSVTDREKVFETIRNTELVYHLAAAQHEANVPDQTFWDVNVNGTKNMLEASLNAGVGRFVHGSTIGVYGASVDGRLDEQSPLNPDNIYGITKLEGEKVVLSFQEKLPVVVIRISEVYGPGDHRLLKLFRGIKKNLFYVIGNGQNVHHLIYIDDLIEGLGLAATVKAAIGQVLVLSGKEPLSTSEMVKTIASELGTKTPAFRLPLLPFVMLAAIMEGICRPLGIQPPLHRRRMDFFRKNLLFSQERARNVLGFVPRFDFKQGIAHTCSWYKRMGYL